MTKVSIGVVMTCFNRREYTLRCLRHLYRQTAIAEGVELSIFLTDDGSKDGTADAVAREFPDATILRGSGSLFWNGGMNMAYGEALKHDMDYFLWMNDDTFLFDDGLARLLATHRALSEQGKPNSMVLGGCMDPRTGKFSYGGFRRVSKWTLKMVDVQPGTEPRECTTNTGNCVLIPRSVARKVGNIEPFYTHRWGDPDYGLRARKAGCEVWLAPNYIAECEMNPTAERWRDTSLSLKARLKDFHSVKGYVKKDWFFYVKRHGGLLWMLLWLKPYFDMVTSAAKVSLGGKRAVPQTL